MLRQLTYSVCFKLGAVHQHWRSYIRDDKIRKANNSFNKHRWRIKRSNRLKRVSILHQLYKARLLTFTTLSLMFWDKSLKSSTRRENMINTVIIISW